MNSPKIVWSPCRETPEGIESYGTCSWIDAARWAVKHNGFVRQYIEDFNGHVLHVSDFDVEVVTEMSGRYACLIPRPSNANRLLAAAAEMREALEGLLSQFEDGSNMPFHAEGIRRLLDRIDGKEVEK